MTKFLILGLSTNIENKSVFCKNILYQTQCPKATLKETIAKAFARYLKVAFINQSHICFIFFVTFITYIQSCRPF